jgi:conjugative relaxase-like TrwC/TraI family protein
LALKTAEEIMVHIHGASLEYLAEYHATGHDRTVAEATAALYLDAEQTSQGPEFGGRMAAFFGMSGEYDRYVFMQAAEGKYRINGNGDTAIRVQLEPLASWRVAAAVAKGAEKEVIDGILRGAAQAAMARLQDLVQVRVTKDGVTHYEHPTRTNAALFSGTEFAIGRHVMCADGQVRVIDPKSLAHAQLELDAVYKLELARAAAAAGFALDMTEQGPELRCVSPELRSSFRAKSLSPAHASLHIRPEGASYTLAPAMAAREAVVLALEELHERSDVINSRYELAYAAAKYRRFAGQGEEINRVIDEMLAEGYLVQRAPTEATRAAGLGKLTSQFAIERERASVETYKKGLGLGKQVTDEGGAEAAIKRVEDQIAAGIKKREGKDVDVKLTKGQRDMVMAALGLTNRNRVLTVRGDPGTGKTTGMEATRYAAQAAGWRVLGLAPSDVARDALQSSGVDTETVQLAERSLAWWDQVDDRTMLIVDEAGMIDSRQMNIVLERANARGAKVCLVGDYEQLQAVEAGTPFELLCREDQAAGHYVEMTEMSRARTKEMHALHVLSRDDQEACIRMILKGGPAGQFWSHASEAARYEYVASKYLEIDPAERFKVPVIVDTNRDRRNITAVIRKQMGIKTVFTCRSFESMQLERAKMMVASSYQVGDAIRVNTNSGMFAKGEILEVVSTDAGVIKVLDQNGQTKTFNPANHGRNVTLGQYEMTDIGVGEIIKFSSKWAEAKIRNGDRGIVRAIDPTGNAIVDIVDFDGKVRERKALNLARKGVGVRHGVASTVHGVQGASIDRGIYLSSNTSRNAFLVGVTRFKFGVTVVADVTTERKLQKFIERAEARQAKERALLTPEQLAAQIAADEEAMETAARGTGNVAVKLAMPEADDRDLTLEAQSVFQFSKGFALPGTVMPSEGTDVYGFTDVRYHSSGKKADEEGKKQDVDAAIEAVISPPKSWSIACHLAKGERKTELQGILKAASLHAMERMQDLVRVRVTRDGVTTQEKPLGIQWTMFAHSNTRRGDPDEHKHFVINKHALCADGKVRTIDEASWLRIHYEMDAYFKTELARLAAEAGYELDVTEHGPELRCIKPELRKAFSTAREEMRVFLESHGVDLERASESQRQWANMSTRLGKVQFDEAHVDRVYRARVADAGMDYDAIRVEPEFEQGYTITPVKTAREAVLMALEEMHERSDVIKHRHELALVTAKYRGFSGSGDDINQAIDQLLAEGYLLERAPIEAGARITAESLTLTSRFAVEREQASLNYFKAGVNRGVQVTSVERAEAAIKRVEDQIAAGILRREGKVQDVKLSQGQRDMVMSALGLAHADRVMAVRGDPGTGKTTGMEATRLAAEEAGWQVLGLAPSDMARDALSEAGVAAETVQLAAKSERWWDDVTAKTLIIMDESGMVDSRQMNIVLERAQAKGARICLVGDYEQVESVEAGTPFKRICKLAERMGTAVEMTQMSRARTTDMHSLHELSRDDQTAAIKKILGGGPAGQAWFGTKEMKSFHELGRDAQMAMVTGIVDEGAAGKLWAKLPELHHIAGLQGKDRSDAIRNFVDSGAPAARMWSSSNAQKRYEYVAEQWLKVDPAKRFRVPIIVDTNADRKGVTDEIRTRMGIETVYTVKSFESLQAERAKHLIAATYEPGQAIKMNNQAGRFVKGEILDVESVQDGVVKVRNRKGELHDFRPEVHGFQATLGEYEETAIGVGEIIRFSSKWKEADVRNGDRGIVKSIDATGKAVVDIVDYDGKVRFTKAFNLATPGISLRHGLASTVHGVQGASIDEGIYLTSNTSRNQFLVGITRFKFRCTLVADASTQTKLEALIVRAQTRQHKEPALPSKADLTGKFRRIAVNAAWPEAKVEGGRAAVNLMPFPKETPMDETYMRAFLSAARQSYGKARITGSKQFVDLARQVAESQGQSADFTFATQQAKRPVQTPVQQASPRAAGA